ncbi:MAG TPA: MFS transporter, partial [Polyangia bacterium]
MSAAAGTFAVAPARAPVNKWLVTLSVTFGTLMGAIDTSIVAVATPHLSGSLGATVEEITWVTTGFVIATVVVMPLTAFLGRFFGQKRVYLFCLGLFVVGSALCGLARSLPMMVA